jgi:hypothetical protein
VEGDNKRPLSNSTYLPSIEDVLEIRNLLRSIL